jgi:hypothetical protein
MLRFILSLWGYRCGNNDMAVKLNLLPPNYALSGPVGQIVKFARPLNVILLALFIITVLGMGGFFIFSSLSLKNLTASNDVLKNQIQGQSAAQQQMVLLKDRLGKIKTVQGVSTATKSLTSIDPFLALITGDSTLSELNVNSQKVTATIVFKSNSGLTNFLKSVSSSTDFSLVTLGTFSYNPTSGFQVGLNFTKK